MPYWYNVDTGQVETDDNRGQDANVMGPYESEAEAARALQPPTSARRSGTRRTAEWNSGASTSGDADD